MAIRSIRTAPELVTDAHRCAAQIEAVEHAHGTRLIENRSIAKMVRSGHAVVRKAS